MTGSECTVANNVPTTLDGNHERNKTRKEVSKWKEVPYIRFEASEPESPMPSAYFVDTSSSFSNANASGPVCHGPVAPHRAVTPSYFDDVPDLSMDRSSLISHWPSSRISSTHSPLNRLATAFINRGGEEKVADVTLVGKNGVKVRASKSVLASHSPLLADMLRAEQAVEQLYIGNFSGNALRAMSEHCHSAGMWQSLLACQNCESVTRMLVELTSLAATYQLDHLYGEADLLICEILGECPKYATAAFDALGNETETLEACLVQFIKERSPALLMETKALKYLSKERFLDLLNALNCCRVVGLTYILKWIELNRGASASRSDSSTASANTAARLAENSKKSLKSKRRRSSKSKGELEGQYHQLTLTGEVAVCSLDTKNSSTTLWLQRRYSPRLAMG